MKGSEDFSEEVPEAAGEYTVKATIAATDNYNGGEAVKDFTISSNTGDTGDSGHTDNVLAETCYGRLFIRVYYALSPTAVKWFGDCQWFRNFFRDRLDKMVSELQEEGFESTPYEDREW